MSHLEWEPSDYIVYVDESGDHSLVSIDEGYPVFVLSFCVFLKKHYSHAITPALRMLKFETFGHDMVILHEQDIRKKIGAFHQMGKERRDFFLEDLNALIAEANFTLLVTVIDKYRLKEEQSQDTHLSLGNATRIGKALPLPPVAPTTSSPHSYHLRGQGQSGRSCFSIRIFSRLHWT